MITLTRSQVRRLRVVFRRSALGITHRGIVPELVLRAEGGQLRAQHRYCDLAVEYVEPGNYRPAASRRHPARRPGRLRGPGRHARRPRVRRPGPDRRPVGGPRHPAEPRVRPHHARRPRWSRCPALPATWASNPAELLDGPGRGDRDQHRPTRPGTPSTASSSRAAAARSSPPTAGNCWSAPASASPGPSDLLIKGSPIFACRALPRDQPVEVGRTDTHVVFRVGPWTICLRDPEGGPVPGRGAGDPRGRRRS